MIRLQVTGMTCGGCAAAIEKVIKTEDPDAEVAIDVASGKVEVATRASATALMRAIEAAGYGAAAA